MYITEYKGCKIELLREIHDGYYAGCVDVRVITKEGVSFLVSAMTKESYELEMFVASLGLEEEKLNRLAELIDEYGTREKKDGRDSEAEALGNW